VDLGIFDQKRRQRVFTSRARMVTQANGVLV
jgi:hypothetical protein